MSLSHLRMLKKETRRSDKQTHVSTIYLLLKFTRISEEERYYNGPNNPTCRYFRMLSKTSKRSAHPGCQVIEVSMLRAPKSNGPRIILCLRNFLFCLRKKKKSEANASDFGRHRTSGLPTCRNGISTLLGIKQNTACITVLLFVSHSPAQ